jgi:cell division protein FtsW
MIGNASVVDAARDFGDKWYYLKLQSLWALIGLAGFLVISRFDHLRFQKIAPALFYATLALLILVLIPGIGTKLLGARRWINVGFANLQPSELAKLTVAIYFSHLLAQKEKLLNFVLALVTVCGLIMLEPDLGTMLVLMGMGFLVYFTCTGKVTHILGIAGIGLIGVIILIVTSNYRLNRLLSFFDPSRDPLGSSYQIQQSLIALGNGKIFGLGLGQSRQKYNFLPETATDSIFAVIGEETGLVGSVALSLIYLVLTVKGFEIAAAAKSVFSSNLAVALTGIIGFQAFINISANTALLPLTGIPLNYVSYGGSSLVVMLLAAGILVNISVKYAKR